MTAQKPLPAPLVPADVNLQHYPAMPLKLQRLHDSRTWRACRRRPELGFYHVNLWAKAYHQVPAGSLNDDDDELIDFARCDASVWPSVRADLMRGWVRCSDGRLYHPVVAEVALESWLNTLDHRTRAAKMRRQRAVKNTADLPAPEIAKLLKEIDAELAGYDRQTTDTKARLAKMKAANETEESSPVGLVALTTTQRDDTVTTQAPLVKEPRDDTPAECDVTKPLNRMEWTGGERNGLRSSTAVAAETDARAAPAAAAKVENRRPEIPQRPTFHAEKTAATAAEARAIGPRVLEAAGIDPTRWLGTWANAENWLRAGYSLDDDILPAIREIAARPGYSPPGSLNYFTAAIAKYRQNRTGGGATAMPPAVPAPTDATARWPAWVRTAARSLTEAQAVRAFNRWHQGGNNARELDEHVGVAVLALGLADAKAVLGGCPALRTDRQVPAYTAIGRRVRAGEDCSGEAKPEGVRA